MAPMLRLYEDVLSNGADIALPAMPRMIFVVHGSVEAAGRAWRDDEAWCGVAATSVKAGRDGATLWRWELAARDGSSAAAAPRVVLREKLSALYPRVSSSCGATASPFRRAAAPICTGIRVRASAV